MEQTGGAFEFTDFAVSHAGCAVTTDPARNYDFEECFSEALASSEVGLRDNGRRVVVFLADEAADLPALPAGKASHVFQIDFTLNERAHAF